MSTDTETIGIVQVPQPLIFPSQNSALNLECERPVCSLTLAACTITIRKFPTAAAGGRCSLLGTSWVRWSPVLHMLDDSLPYIFYWRILHSHFVSMSTFKVPRGPVVWCGVLCPTFGYTPHENELVVWVDVSPWGGGGSAFLVSP